MQHEREADLGDARGPARRTAGRATPTPRAPATEVLPEVARGSPRRAAREPDQDPGRKRQERETREGAGASSAEGDGTRKGRRRPPSAGPRGRPDGEKQPDHAAQSGEDAGSRRPSCETSRRRVAPWATRTASSRRRDTRRARSRFAALPQPIRSMMAAPRRQDPDRRVELADELVLERPRHEAEPAVGLRIRRGETPSDRGDVRAGRRERDAGPAPSDSPEDRARSIRGTELAEDPVGEPERKPRVHRLPELLLGRRVAKVRRRDRRRP